MMKSMCLVFVLFLASEFGIFPQRCVTAKNDRSASSGINFDLNRFNIYNDMFPYMMDLRTNRCPRGFECRLYAIGNTTEHRRMDALEIFKANVTGRKTIWIGANLAARDWLSTTTAFKILDHLIYQRDDNASRLLEKYDWIIAPMLNPDGYEYSRTTNGRWPMNRRPVNASCIGVNLNYNFEFRWGIQYNQHLPCSGWGSHLYCGPSAASEKEVQAIQDIATRIGHRVIAWIALQQIPMVTNGTDWVFPYGSTIGLAETFNGSECERTDDYQDLMDVAIAAGNAAGATFDTSYNTNTSCYGRLPMTGTEIDYIKAVQGVKFVYSVSVYAHDLWTEFVPPKNVTLIQPSFLQTWNGLVAMCDAITAKE